MGRRQPFAYHNHWHLALYHLDLGDVGRPWRSTTRGSAARRSDVALEMVDASALLWRALLLGADVGDRFAALAEDWGRRVGDAYYAFNDVHAAMALLGAGRGDEARGLTADLARHAEDGGTNGRMIREVGLPVARSLEAFARGDHAACVDGLLAVRDHAVRFGGSNAQRDVLSLTALEAALRGGLVAVARALAEERVRARPANPAGWVLTGRALDAGGDAAGAAWARDRARDLRETFARRLAERAGAPRPPGPPPSPSPSC